MTTKRATLADFPDLAPGKARQMVKTTNRLVEILAPHSSEARRRILAIAKADLKTRESFQQMRILNAAAERELEELVYSYAKAGWTCLNTQWMNGIAGYTATMVRTVDL